MKLEEVNVELIVEIVKQ